MGITRFNNSKQLGLAPGPGAIMTSSASNEATWLADPGADRIAFYDLSADSLAWLSLGPGLSFNGTTLETSAGAGFISAVQEEGVDIGAGVTTLNFKGSGYTATKVGAVAEITLDTDLNAIADLITTGFAARTGAGTWSTRTITGTAGRVSVANDDGIGGNPVINIDSNVAFKNATETISAAWTFSVIPSTSVIPTLGDHIVNKTYVDGLLAGVRRSSAQVATTGTNITLSGEQTIDGVLTSSSRVLVRNQTNPAQNGLYISAAGAWTRTTDMDTAGEVDGTLVIIEDGTQAGQQWYTVSEVVTLGTDPINFTKIQVGVIDGSGAQYQVSVWQDSDTLTGFVNYIYDADGNLTIGHTTANTNTTRLTLRSASSGHALATQTSAGVEAFKLTETGSGIFGTSNPLTVSNTGISRATQSITVTPGPGASISLVTGAGGATTVGGGGAYVNTSGNLSAFTVSPIANLPTGTAQFSTATISPSIDQTTGGTGVTRGLYVSPSLTATTDFRGVELNVNNSHYAMYSVSGKWRVDFGSDATGDMIYRDSTGKWVRLGVGTNQQVLVGGTTPSWGPVPVVPTTECFYTHVGAPTSSINLSTNAAVKDRNGNTLVFNVPSNLQKLFIFRNGQLIYPDGAGGTPSRDYLADTATHIVTFNESVVDGETFYIYKLA